MTNKLNLIPNKIVGYRLRPDQWNWTVVQIKEHGENSKNPGQQYETPISYQKDIRNAISYIVNHVAAIEGEKLQQIAFDTTGVAADLDVLKVAFEKAEKTALSVVDDLIKRLEVNGYDLSVLTKKNLESNEDDSAVDEEEKPTGT